MDLKWTSFKNIFLYYFHLHFPLKKYYPHKSEHKSKNTKHSEEIESCKGKLDLYYVLSRYNKNYKNQYDQLKFQYNNILKNSQSNSIKNRLTQADNVSKVTWQIINELTNHKSKIQTLPEGSLEELANDFNLHFVNSSPFINKPDINQSLSTIYQKNHNSMFLTPVTQGEVEKFTQNFKNKKSSGEDNIPIFLLKKCIHTISSPISYLINFSFESGKFPLDLKKSTIVPVFKKGDKEVLSNYRPISLQSSFSKLFEKAMYDRLMSFLVRYNTLHPFQHGFLKGRSVDTAIQDFIEPVLKALEAGQVVCGLFLDLSKAFDSLNHELLLSKMCEYGIRAQPHQWMESYLKDRTQVVKVKRELDESISKRQISNLGIPQGSILGPLLFIIFLNDMPLNIDAYNCKIVNYADDTNVILHSKSIEDLLVSCEYHFECLENWFIENRLGLNAQKTQCVFFKTNRNKIDIPDSIKIQGNCISVSNSCRLLGVNIDSCLNFQNHVECLLKRLSSACYALRVLAQHSNLDTLKTAYYGIYYSYLKYGIIFWGSPPNLNTVFKNQKMALRIINKVQPLSSCRGLFKSAGLLTLPAVLIFERILFVKRNSHIFDRFLVSHSHSTRGVNVLYNIPMHHLTLTERNCFYSCIKLCNQLPKKFGDIKDLKLYKRCLFKFLCDIEPYTMEEYHSRLSDIVL